MLTPADLVDLTHQQFSNDFLLKLRQIYSAENYCLRRLPLVAGKLPTGPLPHLLNNHLPLIKARKADIERIFAELDLKAGGIVCAIFKKLIRKAGNVIYHIKARQSNTSLEVIDVLLEISIYRGHVYNNLHQMSQKFEHPLITPLVKKCVEEEDRFFYELLHIRKTYEVTDDSKTASSSFEVA